MKVEGSVAEGTVNEKLEIYSFVVRKSDVEALW